MFEKDKMQERYIREDFTYAESLYKKYIEMREVLSKYELMKYSTTDPYSTSEDFKQGFIAAIKIMSSIFMDL